VFGSIFFRAFFGSLYRCLARGARAVLQVYPENLAQRELILSFAMRAGFAGGVVVDFPHRYAIKLLGQSYNRLFLHVKIASVQNILGGLLRVRDTSLLLSYADTNSDKII
jgi:hypothetical protein